MTTETQTLPDFLLARIAEDQEWARLARDASDHAPWHQGMGPLKGDVISHAGLGIAETRGGNVARFISMHDPARVVAECEAKRQVLRLLMEANVASTSVDTIEISDYYYQDILCALALPYADHQDYRDEWRP